MELSQDRGPECRACNLLSPVARITKIPKFRVSVKFEVVQSQGPLAFHRLPVAGPVRPGNETPEIGAQAFTSICFRKEEERARSDHQGVIQLAFPEDIKELPMA